MSYLPSRPGKVWRLYVDGVEQTDVSGCLLRFVKHRAATHAAGL